MGRSFDLDDSTGLMPDFWIEEMAATYGIIDPFVPELVRSVEGAGVLSYGLSSYGYDVRLANEFHIFSHVGIDVGCVDPKNFNADACVKVVDDKFVMPPLSFALASTVEKVMMPENAMALMLSKSTYARCGILFPPTVMEAGWYGNITLELFNATPHSVRLYPGEGVGQLIFFTGEYPIISYSHRNGKYQNQDGVTFPRV